MMRCYCLRNCERLKLVERFENRGDDRRLSYPSRRYERMWYLFGICKERKVLQDMHAYTAECVERIGSRIYKIYHSRYLQPLSRRVMLRTRDAPNQQKGSMIDSR
jgi:hypothetical protein